MTTTLTRVAEIAAEYRISDREAMGDRDGGINFQPAGVRLDNDGSRTFWLDYGAARRWTLTHDGVGWRAQHEGDDGHVRRLADAAAPKDTFVDSLPLAGGGRLTLDPARRYEIALGSNDARTGAAVFLFES